MAKCDICAKDFSNVRKIYYQDLSSSPWVCPSCGNYKTTPLRDGFLTQRRLREEQDKHAVDFIQPYAYDKMKRKLTINPDFVKHYPDKLNEYITPEEVEKEGLPKLSKYMKTIQKKNEMEKHLHSSNVDFVGDEDNAIKKTLAIKSKK